jgi:hypothetical protein
MEESDLLKLFKDLENECKNLKNELFKLAWYMRGGLTYQEALHLSPDERAIIGNIVKENLDTAKKTGQPFF